MFKSLKIYLKNSYNLILCFLIGIWFFLNISPVFSHNNPQDITVKNAIDLVNQAEKLYKEENQYSQAVEKLKEAITIFKKEEKFENLAISYTNLGTLQLLLGQGNDALESWQQATSIYERLNEPIEVSNSLILQARALDKLSLYPSACNTLILALGIDTEKNQPSCQQIEFTDQLIGRVNNDFARYNQSNYLQGLIILGNVLRKIGELDKSEVVLEKTFEFTEEKKLQAAINFSLGDTLKAKGDLKYERQSPPKYEYKPWYFELRDFQSEDEEVKKNQEDAKQDDQENPKQDYQNANIRYQEACNLVSSKDILIKTQLKLKSLNLWLILRNLNEAEKVVSNINLSDLPKTASTVYAKINYAKSLAYLQQLKSKQIYQANDIIDLVKEAIKDAQEIKNQYCYLQANDLEGQDKRQLNSSPSDCLKYNRAESYALGNLGGLYEYLGGLEDLKLAKEYTQEALYLTQPSEDPDLAYQWQWQLGRLFEAEGKREKAIAYYEAAIETLESVRGDLLSINSDVQFNFRDNVEPLYRQLVAQLLPVGEKNPSQDNLRKAIYYVDSLQLAELENFLQCDLQGVATIEINRNKRPNQRRQELFAGINQILNDYPTKAAFIYPILLKNQISVILKLPGKDQQLLYHHPQIDQKDSVTTTLRKAQESLKKEGFDFSDEDKKLLRKLYQWIIGEEFNQEFNKENIKTLIFILDGDLRKIPMSALLDGEQFVVEKDYVTTVVPGVQLLKSQSSKSKQFNGLIVGATKAHPDFSSIKESAQKQIEGIMANLEDIQILFQGELTKKPLDQFTKNALQRELRNAYYAIVHIVAHGEFDSDPQKAYIVTDDDSDYFLKINELGRFLQTRDELRPIELLFMSSCSTAQGDNRAVLGIAGIAIKSGARGTIAPLWDVPQNSTNEIVNKFYEYLAKGHSKAEALQIAQQEYRKKEEVPYFWAGFVLVGN